MPANAVSTQRKYFNIRNGFMEWRNPDGEVVRYNQLSNVHLVYVDFKKVEKQGQYIGTTIRLHLIDHDDYFILETWQNDAYAMAFYRSMENIDLQTPFDILTNFYKKDGKDMHTLNIKQNGSKIFWRYTKDNPNGMPELTLVHQQQNPDGSIKKIYNSDERLMFFLIKIEQWLQPFLKRKVNPYPFHAVWQGWNDGPERQTRPRAERNIGYTPNASNGYFVDNDPGYTPDVKSDDDPDDLPF